MSEGGAEARVEEESTANLASGSPAPATPRSFSPQLGDEEVGRLTPPRVHAVSAEPCAGITPPRPSVKSKTKGKAKAKSSPIVSKIEQVLDKDTLSEHLRHLKEKQQQEKEARKKLQAEIRNTERRQSRLRKRAKLLTDEDLLQVLMLRKSARQAHEDAQTSEQPGTASGLTPAERPM